MIPAYTEFVWPFARTIIKPQDWLELKDWELADHFRQFIDSSCKAVLAKGKDGYRMSLHLCNSLYRQFRRRFRKMVTFRVPLCALFKKPVHSNVDEQNILAIFLYADPTVM
jgi:hypothetical protein